MLLALDSIWIERFKSINNYVGKKDLDGYQADNELSDKDELLNDSVLLNNTNEKIVNLDDNQVLNYL